MLSKHHRDVWSEPPADEAGSEAGTTEPETELIALPGPVFVDSSGRRARAVRRAGWLVGAACSVYTAALALSLSGATPIAPKTLLPLPGVPSTAPDDAGSSGTGELDEPADQAAPPATAGFIRAGAAAAPSPPGAVRLVSSPSPSASPTKRPAKGGGVPGTPRATAGSPAAPTPTAGATATEPVASGSPSAQPSTSASPAPGVSDAPVDQQPQGGQ
ncbi:MULTISPECIES: hypothetical protein [unclassified Streptomyces]|uniref:hypothetical protein n=1 Tax=unclassified Streptomyces TaxID=2593676 RepID=UPI000363A6B5|nr:MULTISPECIES: hypothetical protein [unclassified Streptomyces]